MHREVGRWWRGLPVYRFSSLGAAESRGNKAGATVIQSKDALERDIECLGRYQMTDAQTGIAQCNPTEKVLRCGCSLSYRAMSISSPMTDDSLCCRHFPSSGSILIHLYMVSRFQGSSHSHPRRQLGFLFLDCRIPLLLRMAVWSTKWYLLRVALYCMPRTVPKI
jgi:hypothetical protein